MTILDKNTMAESNFDRLRSYLEDDSLALVLLDAWVGRSNSSDGTCEMIDALEIFHNPKQEDDEQNTTEEN